MNANTKQPETVPFLIASQAWIVSIEAIVKEMALPVNNRNKEKLSELRAKLKTVINTALTNTQRHLLITNTGGLCVITGDAIGWTKAKTAFSHPEKIKQNKYNALVDEICQELLDEQAALAEKQDAPLDTQGIINAQNDAKDDTKKTVTMESPNKQSKIEIDKETGDTRVFEKDENGEYVERGFFARHWQNIKEFCKNIWNWLAKKWTKFKDWVCSFFSEPNDQEVIMKAAT